MDDWFAVVSLGFFPTPGASTAQRAAFVATWGLFSSLGEAPEYIAPSVFRRYFSMMQNYKQYPRKYTM